jgi:uncharacterized membrane protein YsdA (DUF1294 family)
VKFFSLFIIIALVLTVVIQFLLVMDLNLHFYIALLLNLTLVTFIFYWIDKGLSRIKRFTFRVPELVLNLLTLAGGFVGAWLGRGVFRHKTNVKKHWGMLVILILSTLLHIGLIYWVFFRDLKLGGG